MSDAPNKPRPNKYDSQNHLEVLFRAHGSIWLKVLPFCIVNAMIAGGIYWVNKSNGVDLTFSSEGHMIMTYVVSFLLVKSVLDKIHIVSVQHSHLLQCYQSIRELIQHTYAFTTTETNEEAREWRHDVSYRAMILLRISIAIIECDMHKENVWDVPELNKEERNSLRDHLFLELDQCNDSCETLRWAHGRSGKRSENLRAPVRIANRLRRTIVSNRDHLENKLSLQEEILLLDFVQKFMIGYYGLCKYAILPYPFPLVQMSRAFLLFFVYTLPFVIMSNDTSVIAREMTVVFGLTYGFIGLEFVSIGLSKPFGRASNQFDALGGAYFVFEDIYITASYTDGPEHSDQLRRQMSRDTKEKSGSLSESVLTEKTHLLGHLSDTDT